MSHCQWPFISLYKYKRIHTKKAEFSATTKQIFNIYVENKWKGITSTFDFNEGKASESTPYFTHQEIQQCASRSTHLSRPEQLSICCRGQFRQGLVQGEKAVVHPILNWLLNHLQDLKKRAYLAKFLVKIEVPAEILCDGDIASLMEQVSVNSLLFTY